MDIAKIRKKLKAEGKKTGPPKAGAAPGIPPEPGEEGETPAVSDDISEGAAEQSAVEVERAGSGPEETGAPREAAEGPSAAGGQGGGEAVEEIEVVVFKLEEEDYAFRVSDVEELLRPHKVTSVPMTNQYLLGITSVRGRIVPVVDMERRLTGRSGRPRLGKSKILILRGPKGPLGVLVGARMEFVRLSAGKVVGPPAHLQKPASEYIEGVVEHEKRFVSILDAEGLLDFNTTLEAQ
jgi:purine-binding chemotaxis protein CheW